MTQAQWGLGSLVLALLSATNVEAQPLVSTHEEQMQFQSLTTAGRIFDVGTVADGFLAMRRCESEAGKCAYRSTDGGRTFAPVGRPFNVTDSAFNGVPMTTDGDAAAIALGHCATDTGFDYCVSRSVDGGQTWTVTSLFPADLGYFRRAAVAGNTWLIPFGAFDGSSAAVGRSADNGVTWQPPIEVAATLPEIDAAIIGVAGDGAGTWIFTLYTRNEPGFRLLYTLRSTDDGLTWSPAQQVSFPDIPYIFGADIVGLGEDHFVMLFVARPDLSLSIGEDLETYSARSLDGGQTWQDLVLLNPMAAKSTQSQHDEAVDPQLIVQPGTSRLWAFWIQYGLPYTRDEADIFYAISEDGGLAWTNPAAYDAGEGNKAAIGSQADARVAVASDGTIAAMSIISTQVELMSSYQECPSAPSALCQSVGLGGRSSLRIKNSAGVNDTLDWTWLGADVSVSDFGTPETTTDYMFCLYESAPGGTRLLLERRTLVVEREFFWESTGGGFRGRDPRIYYTPLKTLTLATSASGTGKLRVRALGSALSPPPLPIGVGGSVLAQLHNRESGHCWGSEYAEADISSSTESLKALER